MKASRRMAFFGGLTAPAITLAMACGDGSADAPVAASDGGAETSLPVPVSDSALDVPDAGDAGDATSIDGAIVRTCSNDGFCPTALPAGQTLNGIWGDGTGVVWAVSEQGNVLRWDGHAWTTHATGKGALRAIWGSSAVNIWIGGAAGLFHGEGSSSASLVWTAVPIAGDPTVPILSLWGTNASDVWAAGGIDTPRRAARVLHYAGTTADGGPPWQLDPISNAEITIQKVWGSSTSDVWLGGSNGTYWYDRHAEVYRRSPDDDGGLGWAQVERPVIPQGSGNGELGGGAAFADGRLWVLERTNEERSCVWRAPNTQVPTPTVWTSTCLLDPAPFLRAIWKTAAGDVWVAGDDGFLRRWNGASFSQAQITITDRPVTSSLRAIWGQGSDELWVAGTNIALHRAKQPSGATP